MVSDSMLKFEDAAIEAVYAHRTENGRVELIRYSNGVHTIVSSAIIPSTSQIEVSAHNLNGKWNYFLKEIPAESKE